MEENAIFNDRKWGVRRGEKLNATAGAPVDATADSPPETSIIRSSEQLAALEKLYGRIGELAAPPAVAVRIIQVSNDENANVDDLLDAVESDAALAVRILRVVNSGFHSLRNRVGDLKTAVTMLGFKQVCNLALTGYTSRMFNSDGTYRSFSREGLWNHLVAVAATSRLICETCRRPSPDQAYLAGLLHDVGLVLSDQYLHRHFKTVLDHLGDDIETTAVEREVLSFDHTELGEAVIRKWGLPEHVAAAAGFHHRPQRYQGEHSDIVNIVAIANYLCSRRSVSSLGVSNVAPPPESCYTALKLDAVLLEAILDKLDKTLETASITASI